MPTTTILATWNGLPLLGGVIGYVTNRIAVKMIFRPINPRRILGVRVQGLIGRRQDELADSIGNVVGSHLVLHDDIVAAFQKIDFEAVLGEVLDSAVGPKIEELRSLPLIGGFLTQDRIESIRSSLLEQVAANKDQILDRVESAIEEGLDIQELVREKVAAFPVEKLESLVLGVASRELRAIEALGLVLGAIIGVAQAALVTFL